MTQNKLTRQLPAEQEFAKLQARWPGLNLIAASNRLALHRTPAGIKARHLNSNRDSNPSRLTHKQVMTMTRYMARYCPAFNAQQAEQYATDAWPYVACNPGLRDIDEKLLHPWMLTANRRKVWQRLAPGLPHGSNAACIVTHRILRGIFPTVAPELIGTLSTNISSPLGKLRDPDMAAEFTTMLRTVSALFGGPTPFVQMLNTKRHIDIPDLRTTVKDTLHMLTLAGEHAGTSALEFRTIDELHDALTELCQQENLIGKGLRFPVNPEDAMDINGFTFKPMSSSADAVKTGERLAICVGYAGYSEKARDGDITLLTVSDPSGQLKACVEIKQGRIAQFKLHRNGTPTQDSEINRAGHCFAALRQLRSGPDLPPLNLQGEYRDLFQLEAKGPHWTDWLKHGAPSDFSPPLSAAPSDKQRVI